MNIDLLALAIGIGLGTLLGLALKSIVNYALRGQRRREYMEEAREMWRVSRNASFITRFKEDANERT